MAEGPDRIARIYRKEEIVSGSKTHIGLYGFPQTACVPKGLLCGLICKALLEGSYCPRIASPATSSVSGIFIIEHYSCF